MNETNKPDETDEELVKFVAKNYYKVRDCDMYQMEYKECKSIRGRFQQYYVYGETFDCSKWEEDLLNCKKNQNSKNVDIIALASIIQHEDERLEKRMRANLANDVWKRRSKPPADWDAKLPEWLLKRQENSFLEKEDSESQSCIIS